MSLRMRRRKSKRRYGRGARGIQRQLRRRRTKRGTAGAERLSSQGDSANHCSHGRGWWLGAPQGLKPVFFLSDLRHPSASLRAGSKLKSCPSRSSSLLAQWRKGNVWVPLALLPQGDKRMFRPLVPSLRDSVPFFRAYPGLTPWAVNMPPLRGWSVAARSEPSPTISFFWVSPHGCLD
jgi:hypothetical protein